MKSIAPSVWGASAWRFLDSVVSSTHDLESMSDDELEHTLKFWEWLILPCEECMKNYSEYLKDHPIDEITNNLTYGQWYHNLRESVNRHTAHTPNHQQQPRGGCRTCSSMVRIPPVRRGGVHFMRRFNRRPG